jgi:hypothetical protein
MTLEGKMSLSSERGYPTHSPKRGWNDKELRASDVVEKYRSFSWHRNSMTEFKVGLRKSFVSTFTKNRSGGGLTWTDLIAQSSQLHTAGIGRERTTTTAVVVQWILTRFPLLVNPDANPWCLFDSASTTCKMMTRMMCELTRRMANQRWKGIIDQLGVRSIGFFGRGSPTCSSAKVRSSGPERGERMKLSEPLDGWRAGEGG